MAFYETDCEIIWSQIRQSEKRLVFKRRWLLELPTTSSEQKKCDHADILENRYLPESLLREDDVFYDTVKLRVEEAFGALNFVRKHHLCPDNMAISDASKIRKFLSSSIDSLSNKGLYLIVRTLRGDSVYFEKTRCKMKVIIKKFLAEAVRWHTYNRHQLDVFKQLSQLLSDVRNFRSPLTFLTHRSASSRVAASQVLDMLRDLPTETLFAMRRKLKGLQIVPEMKRLRHGYARDKMINLLLGDSNKILSALHEDDGLPEPFAKAMAVANLSMKLTPGCHNSSIVEFYEFSPKVKTLHDEIVKAIWMIKHKTTFQKLKKVKLLLDSNAKLSDRSLRTAVKKMLMDFLFECSEMDNVPKSLLKALAMINKTPKSSSHKYLPKVEIEKEVDYILGLSSQFKQLCFDLLHYHDFNEDFAAAYNEELEESDENDVCSDNDDDDFFMQDESCIHVSEPHCLVESMGESLPEFFDDVLVSKGSDLSLIPMHTDGINMNFISKIDPSDDVSSFQNLQLLNVRDKMSGHKQADDMDFSMYSPAYRNAGAVKTQLDLDLSSCAVQSDDLSLSYGFTQHIIEKQSIYKNQYLTIQENCDEGSMFAYNLIGHMLEEYAKMDGLDVEWNESLYLTGDHTLQDDTQEAKQEVFGVNEDYIIVRACEKLIPSFCKRLCEGVQSNFSSTRIASRTEGLWMDFDAWLGCNFKFVKKLEMAEPRENTPKYHDSSFSNGGTVLDENSLPTERAENLLAQLRGCIQTTDDVVVWTPEEQRIIEEELVKCACLPSVIKYPKIATQLSNKTMFDVAFRCRWMINQKRPSKKRREEEDCPTTKLEDKKSVSTSSPLKPVADMEDCAGIFHEAIDGEEGQLLLSTSLALRQISENLASFKIHENLDLIAKARDNIFKMMNNLPEKDGLMKDAPPLGMEMDEEKINAVLSFRLPNDLPSGTDIMDKAAEILFRKELALHQTSEDV